MLSFFSNTKSAHTMCISDQVLLYLHLKSILNIKNTYIQCLRHGLLISHVDLFYKIFILSELIYLTRCIKLIVATYLRLDLILRKLINSDGILKF
jgi:hypothetical protein